MRTNPGKIYGKNSYTVSTHRIPTELHDEAIRFGISISETLSEALIARIRARGGSGIEGMRLQLQKKREELELLTNSIRDLERNIQEEENRLKKIYDTREMDLTTRLGPAFLLRKILSTTTFSVMPRIVRIPLHDLEPGMKVVERKDDYILVETDEKHILPDPEGFSRRINSNFDVEALRNDIMGNSLFLGYIEDFKIKYNVGDWKTYIPDRHAEIRKNIMEEISGKEKKEEVVPQ
jgi:hypothetical protein